MSDPDPPSVDGDLHAPDVDAIPTDAPQDGQQAPTEDVAGPSTALAAVPLAALARPLPEILKGRIEKPISENTRRAYRRAWEEWGAWCRANGRQAMPADEIDLAQFLVEFAVRPARRRGAHTALATVELTYQAIRAGHRAKGCPLPTMQVVRNALSSLARERASKGFTEGVGKDPVPFEWLETLQRPETLWELRFNTILLVGFALASRRSELTALRVEDVEFNDTGALIFIQKSKTDQEGLGRYVPILADGSDVCPVQALRTWLEATDVQDGPLLRSMKGLHDLEDTPLTEAAVARMVKIRAARDGVDPSTFSGHSLRSGFVTEMKARGVSDHKIMVVTGHKSIKQVQRYYRARDPMQLGIAMGRRK